MMTTESKWPEWVNLVLQSDVWADIGLQYFFCFTLSAKVQVNQMKGETSNNSAEPSRCELLNHIQANTQGTQVPQASHPLCSHAAHQ